MKCLVVIFLSQTKLCNLEHGVSIVEFLIGKFRSLLKMKDCVSLFRVLILSALCK